MSTAVRPRPHSARPAIRRRTSSSSSGSRGDLAKVMTFRSLYRLEQRGLLDCPIVGVAVDDWTVDDLREHARDSIEATGETARRGGVRRASPRGSPTSAATSPTRRTYERVAEAHRRAPSSPVFYLEIPPFLFGMVVKGLADAGLTERARVVVEKPFGHDLESARALRRAELHQYIDESQLYRIDHFLGKMGLDEILYLRFANAMLRAALEPQLRRVRADHDGRGLRRRGPRALLRPGRRAARRRRQPPDAGGRRGGDGAAGRPRPAHAQGRAGRRCSARSRAADPAALRARPVRRLPRRSTASPPDSTTETYAALRLEIDNWRWSGVPFFIRTGKRLPVDPDRAAARVQARRRGSASCRDASRRPSRTSSWSSSTRPPASGCCVDAQRADAPRARADHARHGVRRRGRRGPDARTRCSCTRRCVGDSDALHPPGRRRGDLADHAAAARRAAAGAPLRAGLVGAGGGRRLRRRLRRLARPVGGVMSASTRAPDPQPAERGRAVAVPADRRLRVPLQLPHGRARRARRRDRLALRARASTRRASSARCSTARPAPSALGPFGINVPAARDLRAGHEHRS